MNPYDTLDVPTDADLVQINAAYRRKAREHHPDAGGDPRTFSALAAAVAILRDPERRERYDATGDTAEPVDDLQPLAMEALVQAFTAAMQAADEIDHVDIIHATDKNLAEQLASIASSRTAAMQGRVRLENAGRRLKHKGGSPAVLLSLIEQEAQGIAASLEALDRQEAVIAAAREMARDYDWTVDPKVQQNAFAQGSMQQAAMAQFYSQGASNNIFGKLFG